jgi:hypothetical protein
MDSIKLSETIPDLGITLFQDLLPGVVAAGDQIRQFPVMLYEIMQKMRLGLLSPPK